MSKLADVVHEVMFPEHLTLCDVQLLALVSKTMRDYIDARREIMQYVGTKLSLPRTQNYFSIKLSKIFKARAVHLSSHYDNPVKLVAQSLYSWNTDMLIRLSSCCGGCFCYDGDGNSRLGHLRWSRQLKTRRLPTNEKSFYFSYTILCNECS
jgi:hypothetical protein